MQTVKIKRVAGPDNLPDYVVSCPAGFLTMAVSIEQALKYALDWLDLMRPFKIEYE